MLLAALFGHLNRIADAVGIDFDYDAVLTPPRAEPATPAFLPAATLPDPDAPRALSLAMRPAAAEALTAWRHHALDRAPQGSPLGRPQRALIARAVAECLGDAATLRQSDAAPKTALDEALLVTADEITLAPFRLGPATITRLRSAGLADDTLIFDAIATTSACTVFSRVEAALAALGA